MALDAPDSNGICTAIDLLLKGFWQGWCCACGWGRQLARGQNPGWLLMCLLLLITFARAPSVAADQISMVDVTTAAELDTAVTAGVSHIRLREHVDLRDNRYTPLCPDASCDLLTKRFRLTLASSVRSLHVHPPSPYALLRHLPLPGDVAIWEAVLCAYIHPDPCL